MTRIQKLLHGFDLATASLIEIGALDRPIVPPDTPKVFYVDHASTPDLRKKYATDPHVNIDRLVDVHGVWGERTLAEIAAPVAPVDGIVASHVIEHVPV